MKLNIDFDELVVAFEESSSLNNSFINTENNEIIFINKEVDDNVQEKLDEMEKEKYLKIPERISSDDFSIMELFVYEIAEENHVLAAEFYKILDRGRPFRRFKDLLEKYPEQKEKWCKFKENQIKNEVINWLCENNIVLKGQKIIPEVEIKELDDAEIAKLPEEVRDFGPMECMNCENDTGIKARYFAVNQDIENRLIDNEARKIMKKKYKIKEYGVLAAGKGLFLTASECPKCKSKDVFWDF